MSGRNLVVHWRTLAQRRADWRAANGLQRSVLMVGRRRRPGAVALQSVADSCSSAPIWIPRSDAQRVGNFPLLPTTDCVHFGSATLEDVNKTMMLDVTALNTRPTGAARIDETKVSQALQDLFASWRRLLRAI